MKTTIRTLILLCMLTAVLCLALLPASAAETPTLYDVTIFPNHGDGFGLITRLTVRLHFATNGGDYITPQLRPIVLPIDLTAITPTREGYTFTGWYRDPFLRLPVTTMNLFRDTVVYAGWVETPAPQPEPELQPEPKPEPDKPGLPYIDVPECDAHYAGVYFVWRNALMSGRTEESFAPAETLTRADLAELLWAIYGKPEVPHIHELWDVFADHPALAAIRWAVDSGVMQTVEGFFHPDAPVDRETLATALYGYVKAEEKGFRGMWMFLLDATDRAEIGEGAYEPICWMTMKGIIKTHDGKINPKTAVTRGETAEMLLRLDEALAD